MLISRVSEGEGEGRAAGDYQTADELFELMVKDHHCDASDNQSLSTRDLIILYKNIDVGTKLMSNANIEQRKIPNQHVENIVHKDGRESDDSDVSETYSNEDLHDIFSINNERIDLINNMSSIQHPLCQKLGDIEIQPSNCTSEYDSHFLFKDPYIKQQLKNINILPNSTEFDTMLPASLLDYICCKRLEDNCNFYMDNIIRYVQHTIEHLKRISNGDYLTDRAKEKWREVNKDLVIPNTDDNKVLATSVSIPIHVMGKADGHRSMWDDIVHSEVDVRSLSKILEKKIIIEVPKLICGSYSLFSDRCADNLIISCKKDLDDRNKQESRVDVVFQFKPSGSGHVISNINSIMILQKIPSIATPDPNEDQHKEIAIVDCSNTFKEQPKIVEIHEQDHETLTPAMESYDNVDVATDVVHKTDDIAIKKSNSDTSDCSLKNNINLSSSQSNIVNKGLLKRKIPLKQLKTETEVTLVSPDELRCAIQRLNMQTPVPEESEDSTISKKKSPTRIRIKSPYENQSFSIEEKKRRKLLEIREKREKKKMALNESYKVTKHKYGKSAVMVQPSNSVTKLSITNKSFYNSIYGENGTHEGGTLKKSQKKSEKKDFSDQDSRIEELHKSSATTLDKISIDDGTTETVMQMQDSLGTETYQSPISMSNYSTDVNLLSQLIGSSGTDCSSDDDSCVGRETKRDDHDMREAYKSDSDIEDNVPCQSQCISAPVNTPKERTLSPNSQDGKKKNTTPVECRKSIDKIYDLLKTLGKHEDTEISHPGKQRLTIHPDNVNTDCRRSSSIQVSDSGTSLKHHIMSSNPSTFSFEKNNNVIRQIPKDKKTKQAPVTVPKVIISSKLQTSKVDTEWNKPDRKRVVTSPSHKIPDNPLKAISQLLQEFSNVQKTRHKTPKKDDHIPIDGKVSSRQGSSKKTRHEQSTKDVGLAPSKSVPYRERRSRPGQPLDPGQFAQQLTYVDDKQTGRLPRRNLSDIIDEAKEARGEAVRGPSKPYSRINTLAQPKKLYVQTHNDEHQIRYGRNIPANRMQRQTTSAPIVDKNSANVNNTRNKRRGPEPVAVAPPKPGISTVPPLERVTRPRRSASNSPARKRAPQPTPEPSFRQTTAPISPDLKKKMVAVESYVISHYGHMPIDTSELITHEVHKSRVPLIPNDIELASLSSPNAEESTELGNQLHYMVDTMINTNAPILSVLTECQESTSKLSDGLEKLSTESMLKIDEPRSESDYPVDIFEDKSILTAVASIPKDKLQEDKIAEENIDVVNTYDVQQFNSATELRKLENALYQQMSVGAFPKRLRIKNLTLTPKQSLQQVIVVQSGDVGSLLVKTSLSQSLRSDTKTDSITALKPLAAVSNTHINWGFTNIPLQVATIGYAFPKYQSSQINALSSRVQALMEKPSYEDLNDFYKSHKTSQCFKGVPREPCLEQSTQANFVVSPTSTQKIKPDTSKGKKEKNKEESERTEECEKVQPIATICERIRAMTQKCEKEQPMSEECNIKQIVTEKYETVQETKESETIESVTKRSDTIIKDVAPSSKMSINNDDITASDSVRKPSGIIDHSTSLDILMGLLNEIRKITGEATNNNNANENDHTNQSKELEIILNNAATHESSIDNNCRDLVSISSFDKLHQLDSNPSICSFNILKQRDPMCVNNENKGIIGIVTDSQTDCTPKHVDKEVIVDIEKKYVSKITDTPSCFFPLTISHSTNISDSVIANRSAPSTPSVYSLAEYETFDFNLSLDDALENLKTEHIAIMPASCNAIESEHFSDLDVKEDGNIHKKQPLNMKVETKIVRKSYKCASKIITNCGVRATTTFDPLLKVKRDLLVTVYSILVFTVFAALSFPKVFFDMNM